MIADAAQVAVAPLADRLASEDAAVRRAAVAEVIARPEAVDPFHYAHVIGSLWADGRRLQAAFWFYVFQVRSRPWADLDSRGDGAGALRASLNSVLGEQVNSWLGGDLATWRSVAERAMSFEAKLPLGPGRPDGVSAGEWATAVATARRTYREGYDQTLAKAKPEEIAAKRREAGLPVGPLPDPGPPLPDAWR